MTAPNHREIKFRGYDPMQRRWVYGYLAYENVIATKGGGVTVDSRTVGQYTGLKDKNGVEIYSGDLLRLKGVNYEYIFEVYYDDQSGRLDIRTADHVEHPDYLDWFEALVERQDRLTVIGNIYENPELLEIKV